MRKPTVIASAGLAAVALTVALVGCGSDTKTGTSKTATSSGTSAQESTDESTTAAPKQPKGAGKHRTIQDYIQENDIQETTLRRGDPGPSVDLPIPEGWEAKNDLPEAPYGAIIYTPTAVPENPPRILAIFERLTGNDDPEQILALAPGELQNIPGFDGPAQGNRDSLAGYDAVQLGGSYNVDGKQGMIAQKTVVIPGPDGVYVLQLNAYSDESEADILMSATDQVDKETTMTF